MKKIIGLNNHGNTCYISSAFQCLLNLDRFVNIIFNIESTDEKFNFFKEFVDQMKNDDNTITTNTIDKTWKSLLTSLKNGLKKQMNILRQNDIDEFIILFLNYIHEKVKCEFEFPTIVKHVISKRKRLFGDSNETTYDLAIEIFKIAMSKWKNHFEKDFSPLINLVNLCIISQIKCNNCKKLHTNHEFPNSLQLDLSENLNDSIRSFLSPMLFNLKNDTNSIEWHCDNCKTKPETKKLYMVCTFPSVLMISLKRFQMNQYGIFEKQNKKMDIPLLLDLKEFEVIPNTLSKMYYYDLYSVACHSGNLNGGHYYSIINKDDIWYKVDDDEVNQISDIDKVKQYIDSNGYMLFYSLPE